MHSLETLTGPCQAACEATLNMLDIHVRSSRSNLQNRMSALLMTWESMKFEIEYNVHRLQVFQLHLSYARQAECPGLEYE